MLSRRMSEGVLNQSRGISNLETDSGSGNVTSCALVTIHELYSTLSEPVPPSLLLHEHETALSFITMKHSRMPTLNLSCSDILDALAL